MANFPNSSFRLLDLQLSDASVIECLVILVWFYFGAWVFFGGSGYLEGEVGEAEIDREISMLSGIYYAMHKVWLSHERVKKRTINAVPVSIRD